MRVKMSKEIVSLGICSTLSLAVIVGVFNWMDGNAGLSSETALHQAELSVARYCQQKGISAADLELLDATAPEGGKHGWQFKFKSPGGSPITVEIDQGGKSRSSTET